MRTGVRARARDAAPREPGRDKRQRREVFLIFATALAAMLFAAIGTRLPQVGVGSSVGNDVVLVALINIQLILLVFLVFLVGRNLAKLVFERRRRILGSHLSTRLLTAFVAIALFPALLLLLVALTFMDNSIEKWFDVQVEESLRGSIEVAQEYYENLASTALFYGQKVSDRIAGDRLLRRNQRSGLRKLVRHAATENRFEIVEVFDASRERLAAGRATDLSDEIGVNEGSQLLDEARSGRQASGVDQVGESEIVRAAVPIYAPNGGGKVIGAVVIGRLVPPSVAQRKLEIDRSFGEYVRLKIQKNPIKTSYTIALVLVSMLVVFAAMWTSFRLARGITVPIKLLAEGTRAVAHGDWDHRIEGEGEDEIGTLVGAFNQMTSDLKATNAELEARRRYVELVLANIGAGVVSIDRSGIVTTLNKGAEALLDLRAGEALGHPYTEVFGAGEARPIGELFDGLLVRSGAEPDDGIESGLRPSERQVTLTSNGRVRSVHLSGARLRDDAGRGIGALVFLEDVTHILKVQRMEAWREVARRIAHEIKNPLTPIALSAQRLRRRYAGRLDSDGGVFEECTRTIEQQVGELKALVNEFSAFARMPSGEHTPQDLNQVIDDTLVLFREGHPEVEFVFDPARDLPILELDREGAKRAIVNLLHNAVAACAAVPWSARIDVATRYDEERDAVCLEIADNGVGLSAEVKDRMFEPYFSTKKDGTGLGLAIVSDIVADHAGFMRVRERHPNGTAMVIEFPVRGDRYLAVAEGGGPRRA